MLQKGRSSPSRTFYSVKDRRECTNFIDRIKLAVDVIILHLFAAIKDITRIYVLISFHLRISRYAYLSNNIYKRRIFISRKFRIFVPYQTHTKRWEKRGKPVCRIKAILCDGGSNKVLKLDTFSREKKSYMVNKLSPNCVKIQSNSS